MHLFTDYSVIIKAGYQLCRFLFIYIQSNLSIRPPWNKFNLVYDLFGLKKIGLVYDLFLEYDLRDRQYSIFMKFGLDFLPPRPLQ